MAERDETADEHASAELVPTLEHVEEAERRIRPLVRETPVLSAGELSRRLGATVVLKAENLQRTGSFKPRGALNKMAQLSEDELKTGVVTASAGNHGQGVALAARQLDTNAVVFMPTEAPLAKVEAVKGYGAEVRQIKGPFDQAERAARRLAAQEGRTFVPPFDDHDVIAGQGTVGLEIARQAPESRLVVLPLGGGGLASGVAMAVQSKLPDARVVGVQAEGRAGSTICDGIAVKRPGQITQPFIGRYLDDIVSVDDDQAAEAMVLLLERSKLVVEGAGAVGVAALMHGKVELPKVGQTCVILSGGNVDASLLAECIRLGETAAGRRLVMVTVIPDKPGALERLLHIVAEHGGNVVDVEHIREGMDLHVRETAVHLVLQTRGRDHGEEITRAIEAEGFSARIER
jgi:threonine dehydratase